MNNNKKPKLKVDKNILIDPLDDKELKEILNYEAPILKYSQLKNYSSIEQLLPNDKSMVIILYEWQYNMGHWTALCRFKNKIIYFDSYGNMPDEPLTWNSEDINNELGQNKKYLSNLLNKTKLKVVYNPIQYQNLKGNMATCGRFCSLFLLLMKEYDMDLQQYFNFMNQMKKSLNIDYDNIVSYLIDNKD